MVVRARRGQGHPVREVGRLRPFRPDGLLLEALVRRSAPALRGGPVRDHRVRPPRRPQRAMRRTMEDAHRLGRDRGPAAADLVPGADGRAFRGSGSVRVASAERSRSRFGASRVEHRGRRRLIVGAPLLAPGGCPDRYSCLAPRTPPQRERATWAPRRTRGPTWPRCYPPPRGRRDSRRGYPPCESSLPSS